MKRELVGSAIAATAMVLIAVPWSVAPTGDQTWVMGDIERAADGFDGAFPDSTLDVGHAHAAGSCGKRQDATTPRGVT
jgi:hypothetical protein